MSSDGWKLIYESFFLEFKFFGDSFAAVTQSFFNHNKRQMTPQFISYYSAKNLLLRITLWSCIVLFFTIDTVATLKFGFLSTILFDKISQNCQYFSDIGWKLSYHYSPLHFLSIRTCLLIFWLISVVRSKLIFSFVVIL